MPNAVNVRFSSLTRPDIEAVIGSVMARSLNSPADAQSASTSQAEPPVSLTWPEEIAHHLLEMSAFGKTVPWPHGMSLAAAQQFEEFLGVSLTGYEEQIKKGVNLITSLNSFTRQGGAFDVSECAELLDCYLSAKALNLIRLLLAFRLANVPEPEWMRQFHHLANVWDMQIIYGLPYVIHRRLRDDVLYWIDATAFAPGGRSFRVHVPATVTLKFYHASVWTDERTLTSVECRAQVLKRSEFVRYIAPQMVEHAVAHNSGPDDLVAWANAPQSWRISERAERIIELDHFGYWRDHADKTNARQDILERLERKIEAQEFGPWKAQFLSMDLSARVKRHLT
jgi:hypothetical protein